MSDEHIRVWLHKRLNRLLPQIVRVKVGKKEYERSLVDISKELENVLQNLKDVRDFNEYPTLGL